MGHQPIRELMPKKKREGKGKGKGKEGKRREVVRDWWRENIPTDFDGFLVTKNNREIEMRETYLQKFVCLHPNLVGPKNCPHFLEKWKSESKAWKRHKTCRHSYKKTLNHILCKSRHTWKTSHFQSHRSLRHTYNSSVSSEICFFAHLYFVKVSYTPTWGWCRWC